MPQLTKKGKPRNIVMIVADSLRYDSVYSSGTPLLPCSESRAVVFSQARSAGCWTLPATASMFTGLMPHQHGGTSQSRGIHQSTPTLAEKLRELGYSTHQITSNVATTHIFGLHRGFNEVRRIWKIVPTQHRRIFELLVLIGKPRLRRRIWSKDFVMGKMSEDLEASKVWLQSTMDDVFNHTRTILRSNESRGQGSFCFLNLMESHFPYHVAPTFETMGSGIRDQAQEIYNMFHLVNQTWLTNDRWLIPRDMLLRLRERQRIAWQRMAPSIDEFIRELSDDPDNLVIFCSDHGDNFGEQGWLYHFSNVTDAGNRVPLFYLYQERYQPRSIHTPVSARNLFHSILHDAGDPATVSGSSPHICREPQRSLPIMQAYWYNNQNRTLPKYRHNQICFLEQGVRLLKRHGDWLYAAPQVDSEEPSFCAVSKGTDPLSELGIPSERLRRYRAILKSYEHFSGTLAA